MVLHYILERQRIENSKLSGVNWMEDDKYAGFKQYSSIVELHGQPHTKDGFHNQLFYDHAIKLIDDGKL